MHELYDRSVDTQHAQHRIKSEAQCTRRNCKSRADTFYQRWNMPQEQN